MLAKKRQINVDLNRRFDQDYNDFFEDRLARAIRFLLRRSDAFIHLHEGSGFYHPTYVDGLRNPGRYGQSIIIDTPLYAGRINLAQVATSVLDQLNTSIVPAWQFRLFNTDTFSTRTTHPEQRKSLTYHALSEAGIPALAIEVSKNISQLGWKVRQQVRATCLTLAQYGVLVDEPQFSEAEVERAGALSVVVNGQHLGLNGESVVALGPGSRIEARAERGGSPCEAVPAVVAPDRPEQNLVGAPRLALTPIPGWTCWPTARAWAAYAWTGRKAGAPGPRAACFSPAGSTGNCALRRKAAPWTPWRAINWCWTASGAPQARKRKS